MEVSFILTLTFFCDSLCGWVGGVKHVGQYVDVTEEGAPPVSPAEQKQIKRRPGKRERSWTFKPVCFLGVEGVKGGREGVELRLPPNLSAWGWGVGGSEIIKC